MQTEGRPPVDDLDYLRKIELLAHQVVEEAGVEGWLAFGDEGETAESELRRSVNALATELRFWHYQADGCLDHD